MKLVRFDAGTGPRCGVIDAAGVREVLSPAHPAGDMAALLAAGLDGITLTDERHAESAVRLLAPIANPPKILCAWVNYPNPAMASMPQVPIFFSKYASAIIGPGDAIELPRIGDEIVVEPEIAAVIGKGGKHIAEAEALDHVAGYTIVNDVTAFSHRLQILLGSQGPYMMAKSFDTFAPMGPCIATADEVSDPQALGQRHWVNGQLETDAHSSAMVYPLAKLISYASDFFRLQPGDVILCGSPFPLAGKPGFLQSGDRVEIEIEGIGRLVNPVVAEG
ncbi:fumarylacetoacetate hydrolase family protein [Novosphingobium sp.]|uniref:fumarylacetoacetate hydrolase family protein n=1 Tax=Novosphingobium sp. TaxID=1874826 RepID=UPI001ECCA7CB|nr:fumarylacetoacetate hydrolase family protein [Novosphingobium sp.]MBK9011936.1 fumarylacetoacetate hydrolase family protein [Novosphingobium sp.]